MRGSDKSGACHANTNRFFCQCFYHRYVSFRCWFVGKAESGLSFIRLMSMMNIAVSDCEAFDIPFMYGLPRVFLFPCGSSPRPEYKTYCKWRNQSAIAG